MCVNCLNSKLKVNNYLTASASSKTKGCARPAANHQISCSISSAEIPKTAQKSDVTVHSCCNLQQSYWAPRYVGSDSTSKLNPKSPTPSISLHEPKPAKNIIELNLPYQVQHYVLKLMERMLEEACYEFALRWIPQKLSDIGCDCAEAFELARWRLILPTEVPRHAFSVKNGQSIVGSLADAVNIRNAAAHRHRCDNYTICNMAQQGENLTSILSDNTRQEKFLHLRVAIREWKKNSNNLVTARAKLEEALLEIAERPINDMDWTPDSVSIEEIPHKIIIFEQNDIDMMDLDD